MRQPKTWKPWTRQDEFRMESLRMEGRTINQIAAALGRSRFAIVNRLGTVDAPKLMVRRLQWLDVLAGPHTIAGVAASMGVPKVAVKSAKRRLRKAGFQIPNASRP